MTKTAVFVAAAWTVCSPSCATAPEHTARDSQLCPMQQVEVLRLPDLHIPRALHSTLCVGGELLVVGGHTSGFVLTKTAEYYRDGEWHVVPTVYAHDAGLSLPLKSGMVLFAGGFASDFGIGQSFAAERYAPATHTFEGFGVVDTKRATAQAIEIDSGSVVISGNWYNTDDIELYDGRKNFTSVRQVSRPRCYPYLFRTAGNDVMVLGALDTKGVPHDSPTIVDRLRGPSFSIPAALSEWQPIRLTTEHRAADSFIGDEAAHDYRYLMLMENRDTTFRIALVRDTVITLIETLGPLPTRGVDGQRIGWFSTVTCDRRAHRGYVVGSDTLSRRYVYSFDYKKGGDAVLYYTVPIADSGITTPVLSDDGDLILAGGARDNFAPYASVYCIRLGASCGEATTGTAFSGWLWMALATALAVMGVALFFGLKRRYYARAVLPPSDSDDTAGTPGLNATDLLPRICKLMDDEQLYLNPNLKVSDLAAAIGVGQHSVSDCINSGRGCTFPQFVNAYRIDYAKQLLRAHPDMKMQAVSAESGFANERSFFRAFKAAEGMPPGEWIQQYTLCEE